MEMYLSLMYGKQKNTIHYIQRHNTLSKLQFQKNTKYCILTGVNNVELIESL